MPTDYIAKIRKFDTAELVTMLQNIKAGKPPRGWASGKAFEHIILRGFDIEKAEVIWPYDVPHAAYTIEQMDGVVYYSGLACLVEAKDYGTTVNVEPIAKLRNQLMRRPPGTLGLVFARSDYTQPMKELTRMMNPLQILLWEYEELEESLQKRRMCQALLLKYRKAVEFGMPDFNVKGRL